MTRFLSLFAALALFLNRELIALCRLAADRASRPELKMFAREVIEARTEEVERFQAWIKAGYL